MKQSIGLICQKTESNIEHREQQFLSGNGIAPKTVRARKGSNIGQVSDVQNTNHKSICKVSNNTLALFMNSPGITLIYSKDLRTQSRTARSHSFRPLTPGPLSRSHGR
jgi:hypothetical protein